MKITALLNENWKLKTMRFGTLDCAVPCSLYSTLLAHGKISDPYYRENEYISTQLCDEDCVFETQFSCSKTVLDKKKITLTFDGIDTLADIYLNGKLIGSADNMHCKWVFDVSGRLTEQNILTVKIYSPNTYIAKKQAERPLWGVNSTMAGYTHIRKAHYMFGWDWGPKLPDMGIFRSVTLTAYNTSVISDVYITQRHEENLVYVNASVGVTGEYDEAVMQIYAPNGELCAESRCSAVSDRAEMNAKIENPKLWWANGYGEQPLYTVKTRLFSDGEIADERCEKIGLRTLTVSRDKDEWGEEFCFLLNGKKLFAMGANYVPEDQILPNCTEKRTRKLLSDCAAANYNCIRVWGGGYYPDDYFYNACDELGLIVWQDFMFACSAYLLTDEFETSIYREIADEIVRIRNHACLGLWCGNNEIESAWVGWGLPDDPRAKDDYLVIFENIIPELLEQYDPETFYHPSSPSSGGGFKDPSSNSAGDMHYWDVWHNLKPIEDFRKYYYRFCSEYGFESLPSIKTLSLIADREKNDFDLMSPVMEAHQKCEQGNEKIMFYLAQVMRYPYSFERLIYSSQLLQADCIRSNVEHMRRARGRCMGSLYWQVNDSNPVISWSSIDWCERWKALHYFAKRFYAPVLLSLDDSDISSLTFNISNERTEPFDGEIRWSMRNNKSEILYSNTIAVHADALSAQNFEPINLSAQLSDRRTKRERYIEYSLWCDGQKISGATAMFIRFKEFDFLKPCISISAEEKGTSWIITLSAKNFAKAVCLDFCDRDAVFEDNWFDIHGSEEVQIELKKDKLSKPFDSASQLLSSITYTYVE